MRFNLQTKLLSSVAIVVGLVLVVLILFTTAREKEFFQRSFKARGIVLAQALEAGIGSREELKSTEKLQSSIYKLIWLDPEIARIDISVLTLEGLQIVASNDTGAIGTPSDPENKAAFEQDIIRTRTIYQPGAPSVLSVITPVHVGGQRLGTYDIRLSLEAEEAAVRSQGTQLTLYLVATVAFITLSLSLLLRKMVIFPVLELRRGSEKLRAGDLSWRVAFKSGDELGDLAAGFNQMAEELKKLYTTLEERVKERTKELVATQKELEEAKSVLEVKVRARTKELEELAAGLDVQVKERTGELNERIAELEKFHKATVGRELKMVELKNEIERLKRELER